MQPLSQDLRMRIVAARENGHGAGATSRRYNVSRRSVERLWNQHHRQGHVRPKRIGGYRRSRLEGHDRRLGRWIAAEPGLTLAQLQERCRTQLGVRVRQTALWHRLNRLGLTYKKTPRAAEQDRPDVKAVRQRWRRAQLRLDATRLVFVDETCLNTRMARLYGRSPRGVRCRAAVPHGHGHISTFIAALRQAAARTLAELQSALVPALASFTSAHCRGFFRHARYASI